MSILPKSECRPVLSMCELTPSLVIRRTVDVLTQVLLQVAEGTCCVGGKAHWCESDADSCLHVCMHHQHQKVCTNSQFTVTPSSPYQTNTLWTKVKTRSLAIYIFTDHYVQNKTQTIATEPLRKHLRNAAMHVTRTVSRNRIEPIRCATGVAHVYAFARIQSCTSTFTKLAIIRPVIN